MPYLTKKYSLNVKGQLQREKRKKYLHGRKFRLIPMKTYSNIFKVFINNVGSTCHYIEMWGEEKAI